MQFYHIPVADLHRKKSHILVCNIYIFNFERQESSISFLHLAAFPARNGYRGYLDLVYMLIVLDTKFTWVSEMSSAAHDKPITVGKPSITLPVIPQPEQVKYASSDLPN